MKVCDNGEIREMTPEEQAMFDFLDADVNAEEAIDILVGATP